MKNSRHSVYFFALFLLVMFIGVTFLLVTEKGTFYLWLNRNHTPALDHFFKAITHLGDGIVFLLIAAMFLLKRIQLFILFLMSYISSGLVVQIMKNLIFSHAVRPTRHFESIADLYLVPGVDVHHYHSFPSGHTATAFALFLLLSMVINNKLLSVVFFIVAALVGVSRIYLSQHFLEDVLAGATIGVAFTFLCHRFVLNKSWFHKKAWMQQSLIRAFDRNDKT